MSYLFRGQKPDGNIRPRQRHIEIRHSTRRRCTFRRELTLAKARAFSTALLTIFGSLARASRSSLTRNYRGSSYSSCRHKATRVADVVRYGAIDLNSVSNSCLGKARRNLPNRIAKASQWRSMNIFWLGIEQLPLAAQCLAVLLPRSWHRTPTTKRTPSRRRSNDLFAMRQLRATLRLMHCSKFRK